MEYITGMVDFIIHIDRYLEVIIRDYGVWTYLVLFLIIFCETGLVVTPFLPGDSLLFMLGALAATDKLDFTLTTVLLIIAAVGGNVVNYSIGRLIGQKILDMKNNRLIKKEYVERTNLFYQKHGGKAIILSRFMPIIRTFAPFVAGIGKMDVKKFFIYNLVGGVSWVVAFMVAGLMFGNVPFIKDNFGFVGIGIVLVSVSPAVIAYINDKRKGARKK